MSMNLVTSYLGLSLRNPLIASPSPRNADLDHLRRLDDAGVGAVVLPSVFQEQIETESEHYETLFASSVDNSPEAQSYLPPIDTGPYGLGSERHLDLVRRAKASLSVPVIASLNGSSATGWTYYASLLQQAGADALELNIYDVPADISVSGRDIERRYLDVLKAVRTAVTIPVVVKMPPYFSSVGHMAGRFVDAGANGLVIFNRFVQPDIDLVTMRLSTEMALSHPREMGLPLLWTALLAGRIKASLAASTGVDHADHIVKYLLAGADAVMTTAAILRHGPEYVRTLIKDVEAWMEVRGIESLDRIRGQMSWARAKRNESYVRAHYIQSLEAWSGAHRA
jgi:dihydroorotate dehydrogenase (fumarate)